MANLFFSSDINNNGFIVSMQFKCLFNRNLMLSASKKLQIKIFQQLIKFFHL